MRTLPLLLSILFVSGCSLTNTTFNKRYEPEASESLPEAQQAEQMASVQGDPQPTSRPKPEPTESMAVATSEPVTRPAAAKTLIAPTVVAPTVANANRPASPQPIHGGYRVERLVAIDEADKFRVDMADWPTVVGKNLPIELKGASLPQRNGQCQAETNLARAAREAVREAFTAAQRITLGEITRSERFALHARVKVDGADLADELIREGLAVTSEAKGNWCQ